MQHVLILIGISGSGKSTFARQFVRDNPTYLRLNRDDLRQSLIPVSLGDYWTWDNTRKNPIERIVTDLEKTALRSALEGGWNIVLDNTHLRARTLNELLKLAEAQATADRPVEVSFQVFSPAVETAVARDRERTDGVGESVIREQYGRFQTLRKQFDTTRRLRFPVAHPAAEPMLQNPTLPRCILVDIDGTAAKIHNRSPFEWTKVGRDKPNWPVLHTVKAMRAAGYAIVFLSGRDTAARPATVDWLHRHLGWQETTDYEMFMRARNDMRKDAIVKRELFDAHIRDRYLVELVLDDRDQVVSLWRRDLGLTCFQVDYGNF